MDTNTITAIIQAILTLATGGFVVKILMQQIKSQQAQINAMKSNIDSMKSFISIFDIDTVNKYVKLSEAKAKMETEQNTNNTWQQYLNSEIIPQLKDYQEQIHNHKMENLKQKHSHLKKENEVSSKYQELFNNLFIFTLFIPEEERENTLKNLFPKNYKLILNEIKDTDPKTIKVLEEKMQKQLSSAVNQRFLNPPKNNTDN